jgi:hypothetical protein
MADRTLMIPQVPVLGHGYGRNVRHDPQSFAYRIGETAEPTTVSWERHGPILDQGNVGACVAFTGADLLMTGPFWDTVSTDLQQLLRDAARSDSWSLDLYRELTRADDYPGAWEPDDTGSDGLTLGKVLTKRGLVNGYRHAMSIGEAHAAIQAGPFAVGTLWLAAMEAPDSRGVVRVAGKPLGGHEYLCFGYDATDDLWWFSNHWTPRWGKDGTFAYDTPSFQKLLGMQGDITIPVPLTAPKPTPVPIPPGPSPIPTTDQPDWNILDPFIHHPRAWTLAKLAASELTRWKGTLTPAG